MKWKLSEINIRRNGVIVKVKKKYKKWKYCVAIISNLQWLQCLFINAMKYYKMYQCNDILEMSL